jgi:hypothetical protein
VKHWQWRSLEISWLIMSSCESNQAGYPPFCYSWKQPIPGLGFCENCRLQMS